MEHNNFDISAVVHALGLKPTSSRKDELRFRTKGSLSVNTATVTFFDHEQNRGGGCLDFIVHHGVAHDQRSAAQWAKDQGILQSPAITTKTPNREHIYRDENGQPIRRAIKYDNGNWSQQRFENNSWQSGVKGVRNIPYGLDRLAKDSSDNLVFIFEGEKDCERAWAHGLLATNNVGGAGNWRDDLNQHLVGRTVCIVPDNDNAGRNHASKVTASLKTSGISCFTLSKYADNLPDKADFSDWMDANGDDVKAFIQLADVAQASQMEADARLHPSFDFIGDIKITPTEWLIDEITAAHTFQSIVGASYSGKSLLAIDMACSVAAGIPFHGRKVQQGTVAYICGEGRSGMLRRIDAWCASHFQELTKLPFILSANALNMRDTEMVQSIKKLAVKVTDLRLIVIDTLNRNFGGGNENHSDAMGEFITACDQLIEHFDCTVCVVHHMGKDQSAGARGHSSFYAALDTEITVKSIGDNDIQISCTKQKDADEFDAMQFIKVPIHDSVVLNPVEVSKRSARIKLSDNQQIAMDTLYEGINPILATGTPKMSCRLHLEDWRKIFHRRHSGDNPKSKNDVFSRARNALQTRGFIVCDDDYFSLGDRATGGDFA